MRSKLSNAMFFILSLCILCSFLGSALLADKAVDAYNETAQSDRVCVIIDAGHGGVDGGAVSCTGEKESNINLEISLRLNDLLHLLGINTKMIRTKDISVYTNGNSIAAKKISDLKERVRIINQTKNAIMVSLHQNNFEDSQYSGAQVFYNSDPVLARTLQEAFVKTINPGSKRKAKKADNIYLMQNINCPGYLIECGFLSNFREETLLRDPTYQKKLCCVIGAVLSCSINNGTVA